jgi:hypothetical protein
VLLANTVFGVRAAAVMQHKVVLVEPDFAQSAKLEVQQRFLPGCGGNSGAGASGVEETLAERASHGLIP